MSDALPHAPVRVVLVDDSPKILVRLQALLESTGEVKVVATARDVPAGIETIEREHPDAVLLDVDLAAGGNGLSVLKHLAAHHPEIAVAGLSNYGWDALRRTWMAEGADAYFDKSTQFTQALRWLEGLAHPPVA